MRWWIVAKRRSARLPSFFSLLHFLLSNRPHFPFPAPSKDPPSRIPSNARNYRRIPCLACFQTRVVPLTRESCTRWPYLLRCAPTAMQRTTLRLHNTLDKLRRIDWAWYFSGLWALWHLSRRQVYALTCWSLLSAKGLHLYAHLHSIPPSQFFLWGSTFFFQDFVLLLLLRILAQRCRTPRRAALCALILFPFG